jgi:hypothetical protein
MHVATVHVYYRNVTGMLIRGNQRMNYIILGIPAEYICQYGQYHLPPIIVI